MTSDVKERLDRALREYGTAAGRRELEDAIAALSADEAAHWNVNAVLGHEAAALSFLPHAKEIMASVKAKLPPGTEFGVMILTGPNPDDQVIAITTHREVVAPAVATWALATISGAIG